MCNSIKVDSKSKLINYQLWPCFKYSCKIDYNSAGLCFICIHPTRTITYEDFNGLHAPPLTGEDSCPSISTLRPTSGSLGHGTHYLIPIREQTLSCICYKTFPMFSKFTFVRCTSKSEIPKARNKQRLPK